MFHHLTKDAKLHLVVRPSMSALPDLPLPFYARSMGHNHLTKGMIEEVAAGEKQFVELFWGIAGQAEFRYHGEFYPVGPGDCFYHLPGEEHYHRVLSEVWEYRWLTFDGALAAGMMTAYDYPATGFHGGDCPTELFLELEKRLRVRSPFAWREMMTLITQILAYAGGRDDGGSQDLAMRAAALCRERYAEVSLNVNTLAELLQVERSTLLRHFRQTMRQSPSQYLMQQRIQHALTLLEQSRLPLAVIAQKCGFADANYFCRVIRREFNTSPSELRPR